MHTMGPLGQARPIMDTMDLLGQARPIMDTMGPLGMVTPTNDTKTRIHPMPTHQLQHGHIKSILGHLSPLWTWSVHTVCKLDSYYTMTRFAVYGNTIWDNWVTSLFALGQLGHLTGATGSPRFDMGQLGQSDDKVFSVAEQGYIGICVFYIFHTLAVIIIIMNNVWNIQSTGHAVTYRHLSLLQVVGCNPPCPIVNRIGV